MINWLGSWSSCCVDEYLITSLTGEVAFKSARNVAAVLRDSFSEEVFNNIAVDKYESVYEALPWTKALLVLIEEHYLKL